MSEVKISVIIPIYNYEKYLKTCLNSITSQSLNDIEIICINDGSTDHSINILNEYSLKDDRFIIINQENKGAGAARNIGLEQAQGEFIAFMDADDYYPDKNVLYDLYTNAIKHNVLICGGKIQTLVNGEFIFAEFRAEKPCDVYKNQLVKYTDFQYECGYQGYIYSNNLIKENNLYFPHYKRYQDPPWFVKTMNTAKEFYALDRYTYIYRSNQTSVIWNSKKYLDKLCGIYDVLDYAQNNNLWEVHVIQYRRLLHPKEKILLKRYLRNKDVRLKVSEILKLINKQKVREFYPDIKLFDDYRSFKKFIFMKKTSMSLKKRLGAFLPFIVKEYIKKIINRF